MRSRAWLFNELVPAATLLARVQRCCQVLDHPVDDCLHLALAEQRSAVFLTQDQRLLRKVREDPRAAGLAMAIEELVLA